MPWFDQRVRRASLVVWLCLAFCILNATPTHAQSGDGRVRWMWMQTPHFNIYYPQGIYAFALRTAQLCEESHKVLVPYARHAPKGRTFVLILNTSDDANGAATALPRNTMYLYTAPPDTRGVLNDSDGWLRGLIYHEYLHILHLDTMSQIFRMVNLILGKVFAPNMLMPRWWVEGWATHVETIFTEGGRGRSSLFSAYMRTAVLSGKPLRLSQVTHATVQFPRGTAAYLYGSRFLAYIAQTYGKDTLTKIAHYFGNTLFPYGMNLVAKKVLKKRYEELWKEWLAHLRKKYLAEAKVVKKHPLTKSRALTSGGEWLGVPRYLPNGREVAVFRTNGHGPGPDRIEIIDRKTKRRRVLAQTNGFTLFGWDRTGKVGVLSHTAVTRAVYYFRDLFYFSPKTGRMQQMTKGERARELDVRPDGKAVVYTRHRAGRTSLWERSIPANTPRLLYRPAAWVVLASPRYSPNGRQVVFTAWFPGGFRDLMLYDLRTRKVKRLTRDRAQNIEPTFTPDGKEILFASDRSGIYNIYGLDLTTARMRQITNEIGGAFAPAISPNGQHIAFARFGKNGLDLHEMAFPSRATPSLYPTPTIRKTWPKRTYPTVRQLYPVRPYSPWQTLVPLTWTPILTADSSGQTIGLRFGGSDILGFHTYDISASFGIESLEFSYNLYYRYSQLYPTFKISQGRYPRTTYGGLEIKGQSVPFSERVTYGAVEMELPFVWWQYNHFFYLRYEMNHLEPIDVKVTFRPADVPPVLPEFGLLTTMTLGWSFSNARRYGRSISPEQGRLVWLQLRVDHPYLGSISQRWSVEGGWAEYISMPWAKRHVLAFNFIGGIGRSSFRTKQVYYLGGIPPQDLFSTIIGGGQLGAGYLRGYPAYRFTGSAMMLLQSEYRLPLINVERGVGVGPLYLQRLHFAFFADVGQVFREPYVVEQFGNMKVGVGAELRLEALIGYYLSINMRFGFAKGLMEGGIDHLYLILGSSF